MKGLYKVELENAMNELGNACCPSELESGSDNCIRGIERGISLVQYYAELNKTSDDPEVVELLMDAERSLDFEVNKLHY